MELHAFPANFILNYLFSKEKIPKRWLCLGYVALALNVISTCLTTYLKKETFLDPVFCTWSFLKSGFFWWFFIQMLRTNRRHFACDRLILTYEITGYRTRKKVKMLQLCGCSTHTKRDTVFLLIQWLCSPFQVYSVVTLMWQSLRTTDGHYARAP